jgi:hypothetical protein
MIVQSQVREKGVLKMAGMAGRVAGARAGYNTKYHHTSKRKGKSKRQKNKQLFFSRSLEDLLPSRSGPLLLIYRLFLPP